MRRRYFIGLSGVVLLGAGLVVLAGSGMREHVQGVGLDTASVPDPGHAPLAARIWFPEHSSDGAKHPLIVVSHGTGGSSSGHSDTAAVLAKAGFVVVAVEHTGDNFRDASNVGRGTHLVERPRHVSRTVDYMLEQWPRRGLIDPGRIGMFGHSAGGFTALVIAGANPDLRGVTAHCRERPQAWDCRYLSKNGYQPEGRDRHRGNAWRHDPRVKAIVIAAPAVGYSFNSANLADVKLPVQLWSAGQDDIVDDSAEQIAKAMPARPDYHLAPSAGHFSFLMPCDVPMRAVISVMHWFGTEAVCSDPATFDREHFHREFNAAVTAFFRSKLGA